jgi:hypothetical protein
MDQGSSSNYWKIFQQEDQQQNSLAVRIPQQLFAKHAPNMQLVPFATTRIPSYYQSQGVPADMPGQPLRELERKIEDVEVIEGSSAHACGVVSPALFSGYPLQPVVPAKDSESPIVFVNMAKSSGKPSQDAATSTQIRAHVMRRFHRERQSQRRGKTTTYPGIGIHPGPTKHCFCSRFPGTKDDLSQSHLSDPYPSRDHEGVGYVEVTRLRTPAASSDPASATILYDPSMCPVCRGLKYQSKLADGSTVPLPFSPEPQSMVSASSLGFSGVPLRISPRMHELIHHCESLVIVLR